LTERSALLGTEFRVFEQADRPQRARHLFVEGQTIAALGFARCRRRSGNQAVP
jgi:hypothetical protein